MTLDEARKVARIAARADNGCSVCVRHQVEELNESFPEFVWAVDEAREYTDAAVQVRPA